MKVRHRVYHPPKRETERFRALFIQAYPIRFSLGGFVDCVLGNINKLMSFLRNLDRKSTRLNSSHQIISYAVFCLKKKKKKNNPSKLLVLPSMADLSRTY